VAMSDCEVMQIVRFGTGFENDGEENVVVGSRVEGEVHEVVERNDDGGGAVGEVVDEEGGVEFFEGREVYAEPGEVECAGEWRRWRWWCTGGNGGTMG